MPDSSSRIAAAMRLLEAGVDTSVIATSVIALWLGHEHVQATRIYVHAHLALKEQALARTAPPDTKPGRYRPPDTLLAFLEAFWYAALLSARTTLTSSDTVTPAPTRHNHDRGIR